MRNQIWINVDKINLVKSLEPSYYFNFIKPSEILNCAASRYFPMYYIMINTVLFIQFYI